MTFELRRSGDHGVLVQNELTRADGVLAARVRSLGAWFDLEHRRIVAPPRRAPRGAPQRADFQRTR